MNLLSLWIIKQWNSLKGCWQISGSTQDEVSYYRTRQYQALIRLMPSSSIANMATSAVVTMLYWKRIDHAYLITWTSLLWLIAIVDYYLWLREKNRPQTRLPTSNDIRFITFLLWSAALLYVSMVIQLFDLSNESNRMLLVAISAAFISIGGWQFSAIPSAAIGWTLIWCVGLMIDLWLNHWPRYSILCILISGYSTYVIYSVLITSRMLLFSLKAQYEIKKQKQFVGLLLKDFEENANDWLWETDHNGYLGHVSERFADFIGWSLKELKGESTLNLLSKLLNKNIKGAEELFKEFSQYFKDKESFKCFRLPVMISGKPYWWEITGKTLYNEGGELIGWRGVASDVTEIFLHEEEMYQLANEDSLTKLPNRHKFNGYLDKFFPENTDILPCTLFFLDLDSFKAINDTMGHAAGDEVLVETAKRISDAVPQDCLVARLGGDEFALVFDGELSHTDIEQHIDNIRANLAKPCEIQEHIIEIKTSIGVSYAPTLAKNAEQLLNASDMALYAAKESGRNKMCFFEPHIAEKIQTRLELLKDMKEAIQTDQFILQYQPQVNYQNGDLSGFEALVRWMHPTRGKIAPDNFIPLAEESGLILFLGKWVLEKACRDAMSWPSHLRVAVNISSVEFENSDVLATVKHALNVTGLPAERLELELTESTLMKDPDSVIILLQKLQTIGVRIALDDFGTGYSSFAYLRKIPINKLKIDRSFINGIELLSEHNNLFNITKAITQLAQSLQLETTAEGIETSEQNSILQELGCTYAQGFLYSRPIMQLEVIDMIAEWFPYETKKKSISK